MDLITSSSSILILLLTLIIILINIILRKKKSKLPPGPWKLPIVISSPEAARQVMKTHDLAFASRPFLLAPYVIYSGFKDIAFAPYGEYWRQMRKLSVLELLSVKRVLSFRRIREEEVSGLVKSLCDGKLADVSSMVAKVSRSVTSRAEFGKVPELSDAFMMVIDNMSEAFSGFRISDMYPSFGLLPVLTGFKGKLEKMHKASDSILGQIIDDHESKRRTRRVNKDGGDDDVIDWTMSEIINDQRILRTVQEEVRQTFKNTGKVEEARLDELKYLDMVISESLRLHPPVPLLVPRENTEKVELKDGYEIPAKTKVIVNAWAISRDPRYWADPEKFSPERFADRSADYKGNDFQFIPFGAGRRICPGMSFAMVFVKLTLANLFFHFNWRLPDDMELDMTEAFGMSLGRKHPLCLIPVPWKIE
ncbi:Desmethyl-deoxy-podophyllotoxin synthase [Linum perenne]